MMVALRFDLQILQDDYHSWIQFANCSNARFANPFYLRNQNSFAKHYIAVKCESISMSKFSFDSQYIVYLEFAKPFQWPNSDFIRNTLYSSNLRIKHVPSELRTAHQSIFRSCRKNIGSSFCWNHFHILMRTHDLRLFFCDCRFFKFANPSPSPDCDCFFEQ